MAYESLNYQEMFHAFIRPAATQKVFEAIRITQPSNILFPWMVHEYQCRECGLKMRMNNIGHSIPGFKK